MKKAMLVFTLAAALFGSHLSAQEARNALLIANGEYSSEIGKLATPIPEAEALKAVLDELGFDTVIVKNADRTEIIEILDEFSTKTKNEGGIAFFHYGGHAVQHNGKNYILPVDSNISNEARLRTRAVESDEIMQSMNADTNIIILDSCRNSPFVDSTRGSASRGLIATTEQPKNSVIVYSAEQGKTASDGVFTPILTQKIAEKGKSLNDILIETRNSVLVQTNGQQCPGEYNQLTKAIYLAGETVVTPDMFKTESPDMRLERSYANIEITSEIAGELYIDKQNYGKILSGETLSLNNIPAAHYTVEVRGEESISKLVIVAANETARVLLERKKQVSTETKSVAPKKNIFSVKRKKWSNSGEIQLLYSKSFFNLCNGEYFPAHGFEIDLCPISLRYSTPVSFAFECKGGYIFESTLIGNEHFTFHEVDGLLSFGFEIMSRFSLMSGAGCAAIWQTFENNTTAISYKGTSDPMLCLVVYPVEMKFRLGEYVSLIGKYKFEYVFGHNIWNIRHSLNIGIAVNCWYGKKGV